MIHQPNPFPRRALGASFAISLVLAVALPSEAAAAFYPPQAESLAMLRGESLSPVQVHYRQGFPAGA